MENMFKVEPRQWSINTDWAEAWSPQFFPQQSFTVDSASFTPQTLPTSYPAPVIPSSGVTSKRQRPMEASQAQKKVKPSPKNQHSPGTTKDGSRTSLCTASPVQQPDHGHNFMPGSTSAAPSPTLPRYTPPLMQHSTDQHTTHNHGSARPSISPIATVVPQLAINTNKTQSQARHKRNSSDGTTNRDNPTWKAAHNLVERNYRDRLNDQIQELSNLLFDNTSASNNKVGSKPPKSLVISRAKDRLRELMKQNLELLALVEKLKRRNAVLDHVVRVGRVEFNEESGSDGEGDSEEDEGCDDNIVENGVDGGWMTFHDLGFWFLIC